MQFTLPEVNIQQFIEEQQSSFELTLENKIRYEANRLLEDMVKQKLLPQIETEIKSFFDNKSTEILGRLPSRMDEKISTVINERIIRHIEHHASQWEWLTSIFSSRWWPKEETVISYVEKVVQKNLEISFNDHLNQLIQKYIIRIWVVDIKDMENEMHCLNQQAWYAADAAYEAGQRDASR